MVWPTLESRTAIRNRTEQNRTFTGCCTVNTRVYFVTNRMEFFCYCFRQCISDRQRDRRTKCTAWNINRKIPSQMFYAAAESCFYASSVCRPIVISERQTEGHVIAFIHHSTRHQSSVDSHYVWHVLYTGVRWHVQRGTSYHAPSLARPHTQDTSHHSRYTVHIGTLASRPSAVPNVS